MRGIQIALPVIALLLSGGVTLAATGTTDATTAGSATTQPSTTATPSTTHRRHRHSSSDAATSQTGAAATQAATTAGTTTTEPTTTSHRRHRSSTTSTAESSPGQAATPATNASRTVPTTTRGEGRFASEGEAAQSCGASNVVWANTSTKAYHLAGDQYFGHTKHGAFMCKTTATAGGFHLAGHKS